MKAWLRNPSRSAVPVTLALSIVFGAITCYLVVAHTLQVPIDFNAAYEIADAKSIGTSFSYRQSYMPSGVYDAVVSANGPLQYIGGLGYALTHSIDGALVAGVLSAAIVLLIGLMLIRTWFSVLALGLLFIFPAYTQTFISFNGYIWAAGCILIGLAILERIKTPLVPLSFLTNGRLWLACVFFSFAMSSKLLYSFAVFPVAFAAVYYQLHPNDLVGITRNALRAISVALIVSVVSLILFFFQVAFAVLHTVRSLASLATSPGIFLSYIEADIRAGKGVLVAHTSWITQIAGYGSHLILVLLALAAIALLVSRPAYSILVLVAGLFWLYVGMDQERISSFFLLVLVLGAHEALRLVARLASRLQRSRALFESTFVALVVLFVLFANPVIGAPAFLPADSLRDYAVQVAGGEYHYAPGLVTALQRYPYVLTDGYWQFAEISDRWNVRFYNRVAKQNAYLWNRDVVLFFDRAERSVPYTTVRANCAAVVYTDGPLVLCRPRPDEPLGYQLPAQSTLPTTARSRSLRLGQYDWTLTSNFHRVPSRTRGAADFEYVGTGAPDGNEYASLMVPVQPGKIYTFSALVDPTRITGGPNAQFDLAITRADAKGSYVTLFSPVGPSSRYSTPPWLCPPGVTRIQLVMQLTQTSVENGQRLRFSDPVLSIATVKNRALGV